MNVTNTIELLKRRNMDAYKLAQDHNLVEVLKQVLFHKSTFRFDQIERLLKERQQLIKRIEEDYTWLYTGEDFINISDYKYKDDEIKFVLNVIPVSDFYFYVDDTCTRRADMHYAKYAPELSRLADLNRIIYNTYSEHHEIIDSIMEELKTPGFESRIPDYIDSRVLIQATPIDEELAKRLAVSDSVKIQTFASVYGQNGLKQLIKCLNDCSNPYPSSQQLFEELLQELTPIAVYDSYREDFYDERFMRALGLLSIKGTYLKERYLNCKNRGILPKK